MADGLPADDAEALDRQGYRVLRGVVASAELDILRDVFDRSILPSDRWPAPRGWDWRHAQLDHHPLVQKTCRTPLLLDCVRHILRTPFFLAQVEGREPCAGGGAQALHRDTESEKASAVAVLVFLDAYGPHNGATRVVAGTHTLADGIEADACTLSGAAGDMLVFDSRLLHGATTNRTGERRRSLLITYADAALIEEFRRTSDLRGVRMEIGEIFSEAQNPLYAH